MPRTWSYRKYDNTTSAAQRERNPPSNLTLYTIILVTVACFFIGFMVYTSVHTAVHPPADGKVFPKTEADDD